MPAVTSLRTLARLTAAPTLPPLDVPLACTDSDPPPVPMKVRL